MDQKNQYFDLNKLKLLDKIGKGEFGEVFCANEIDTGDTLAAKVLNDEFHEYPNEQENNLFFQKINSLLSFSHPSILQFIGFSPINFEKSPFPTFITKYAPNGSLRDIINLELTHNSPKDWNNTRKFINIYGIASCLQYLHFHDIIHLYLKPENILMDEHLFPQVTDYYLTTISTIKPKKQANPIYIAPEVLRDEPYTKSADVYSYSIILYDILTGIRPFSEFDFNELIEKVAIQNLRPELTSDISEPYQNLIKKCWSPNPEERPTFDEIVNFLKENKNCAFSEKVNESELHDYIDYIENYTKNQSFDDFIIQSGRTTTITKVTIKSNDSFFSFKTIKKFFGNFFKGSEKDEPQNSNEKEDDNKGGFFSWSKSTIKKEPFEIESQGCQLRGFIVRPTKSGKFPTVIVSHGFGSCTRETKKYAQIFVDEGYAAVLFDFCMSGSGKSSGSSLGMSALTEKVDLINVLEFTKKLDFVDNDRITFVGCSQGGFVSALAAVECEDEIERLIMYYPALCIPDDARRGQMINAKFDPKNVPDTLRALFVKLSSKYVLDVIEMDPYKEICSFKKPVLIVHGIKDRLVDIKYSRRARDEYENCKLVEVNGDHGFLFSGFSEGKQATLEYLHQFKQ